MSDESQRQAAARAHEKIQDEAARQLGHTPGGLDPWDAMKIADQQRETPDSMDPDELRRDHMDDKQRELDREARAKEARRLNEELARQQQRQGDRDQLAAYQREEAALKPEERAARAQHRREVARAAAAAARRGTPEQQVRLMRVAGLGMALAGIFLLLQGLQHQGLVKDPLPTPAPSAAAATATPPPPSPIAQASPQVNGTGTATASFSKVSGPCRLAAQFTDGYAFAATSGALTLTQLSDNHVTTGRIEPTGDFTTTAAGQSYKGRVTGTTATGQHFYTAEGCNEVYAFTMTFPTPLIAAPVVVPATIAAAVITPTPSPIAATAAPAPSPATPTGGPNVALAALGLILAVGGVGVATGGPALLRRKGEGDGDA